MKVQMQVAQQVMRIGKLVFEPVHCLNAPVHVCLLLQVCMRNNASVHESLEPVQTETYRIMHRRASEFLRNYFASLVDFMISDTSYFSQSLQELFGSTKKSLLQFSNLLLRREVREFANELCASTKASRNPTVWLEGSTGSGQNVNATGYDDDDLGIMDIDENDGKSGKNSAELAALNDSL
ncbi:hypothetical protein TSUD_04480 [Trifolium subterraneum]|nr:hypothetical protein TSUD_04480 [Trifolium subterraneum]